MQISHEAIYRSLFIQTRGVLKKELTAQLRTERRMRRPKSHNAKSGQGHILDMVSIRERPAEIEDRAVPGHWEGDLLTGANDTHIATLVERNTRFTMLVKIPRKDTATVVAALAKHIGKLPEELRRSLTWDQGKEMHAHKRFTVATNIQVYFCDPRSPWQRGSNENTNGLLRQYFPRGTDFSRISQSYLNAIALRLNQRPRKNSRVWCRSSSPGPRPAGSSRGRAVARSRTQHLCRNPTTETRGPIHRLLWKQRLLRKRISCRRAENSFGSTKYFCARSRYSVPGAMRCSILDVVMHR